MHTELRRLTAYPPYGGALSGTLESWVVLMCPWAAYKLVQPGLGLGRERGAEADAGEPPAGRGIGVANKVINRPLSGCNGKVWILLKEQRQLGHKYGDLGLTEPVWGNGWVSTVGQKEDTCVATKAQGSGVEQNREVSCSGQPRTEPVGTPSLGRGG